MALCHVVKHTYTNMQKFALDKVVLGENAEVDEAFWVIQ
jgi:hypothetical protein